ncbi:hypothetical protein LCX93_00140 [Sulfurimonas sp. SWIR-19]|uniref:hypothetical protein n=1 Tax=Sulfurimonas sp. SWIR-19 TaxID=2878390 RepID=UPI001CF25D37|nr:hypothetical protein [Sulfurimonas sp. SWIR-19]UCN00358.1 hypothetical protein LCX93_00140 [Sulfurimonas sp. SWIR-19]
MKLVNITLSVALLGLLSIASADESTATDTTVSVDAQIEAIQSAPEQERVELMNEFKQRLMQMNQEERMSAIEEMQSKMHAQSGDAHEPGTGTAGIPRDMMPDEEHNLGDMTQTRAQEHVQEMQMQTNEHMNQVQNMTQQQAGSQYMQTIGAGDTINSGHISDMNENMMHRR